MALARALLKRPVVLILDQVGAVFDSAAQGRVLTGILDTRRGQGVIWVLPRVELAERFGTVLVMAHGKLAEHGRFETLKCSGGALHNLLKAA